MTLPQDLDEIAAELERAKEYARAERERRVGLAYLLAGASIPALLAPILGAMAVVVAYDERLGVEFEWPWGLLQLLAATAALVGLLAGGLLLVLRRIRRMFRHMPGSWAVVFPLPKRWAWTLGIGGASLMLILLPLTPAFTLVIALATLGASFVAEGMLAKDRLHLGLGIGLMAAVVWLVSLGGSFLSLVVLPIALASLALVGAGAWRYAKAAEASR